MTVNAKSQVLAQGTLIGIGNNFRYSSNVKVRLRCVTCCQELESQGQTTLRNLVPGESQGQTALRYLVSGESQGQTALRNLVPGESQGQTALRNLVPGESFQIKRYVGAYTGVQSVKRKARNSLDHIFFKIVNICGPSEDIVQKILQL